MVKLQKSIDKKQALLASTLTLINSGGIQEASMAKVAKLAGVSPATIYLYFDNKQDLINQLYLEVKLNFSKKAFEGWDPNLPVKKSFEQIWFKIVNYKLNNKEEAYFLSHCDNTAIVDEKSRKEGIKHLQPLLTLWEKGQQEGIIKEVSPYLLYAFTIYPISFLMNSQKRTHCKLDQNMLDQAFQLAWDSIKV